MPHSPGIFLLAQVNGVRVFSKGQFYQGARAGASGPRTQWCPSIGNAGPSRAVSHGHTHPRHTALQKHGVSSKQGKLTPGCPAAVQRVCSSKFMLLSLLLLTELYMSQAGGKTGSIYLKQKKKGKELRLYSQENTFKRVRTFLELAVENENLIKQIRIFIKSYFHNLTIFRIIL